MTVGEVRPVAGMHQRKAEMARQADAFIALPGNPLFTTKQNHHNAFISVWRYLNGYSFSYVIFRRVWNTGRTP